jgi:hypothetical protein
MEFRHDKTKRAIKDLSVFNGLCVPDLSAYKREFLKPRYRLLEMKIKNIPLGHVVYEIKGNVFKFHLVNFLKLKTRRMTQDFVRHIAEPIALKNGCQFIEGTAERKGMAIKLERLGFVNVESNIYRKDLCHVS